MSCWILPPSSSPLPSALLRSAAPILSSLQQPWIPLSVCLLMWLSPWAHHSLVSGCSEAQESKRASQLTEGIFYKCWEEGEERRWRRKLLSHVFSWDPVNLHHCWKWGNIFTLWTYLKLFYASYNNNSHSHKKSLSYVSRTYPIYCLIHPQSSASSGHSQGPAMFEHLLGRVLTDRIHKDHPTFLPTKWSNAFRSLAYRCQRGVGRVKGWGP